MLNFSWDNPDLNMCKNCHWKDDNPELCHGVEPPIKKPFIPKATSDCVYIPETYWQRIPQERKDDFNEDVKKRSKRYWKKNE